MSGATVTLNGPSHFARRRKRASEPQLVTRAARARVGIVAAFHKVTPDDPTERLALYQHGRARMRDGPEHPRNGNQHKKPDDRSHKSPQHGAVRARPNQAVGRVPGIVGIFVAVQWRLPSGISRRRVNYAPLGRSPVETARLPMARMSCTVSFCRAFPYSFQGSLFSFASRFGTVSTVKFPGFSDVRSSSHASRDAHRRSGAGARGIPGN